MLEGELVAFRTIAAGGRNVFRTIAQLALLAASIVAAIYAPVYVVALIAGGGSLALNFLLPFEPKAPQVPNTTALPESSPTYSINAQGNRARLGEPIPVVYGEPVMFPDFASTPFRQYTATNDEYVNELFVVSHGEADVEDILLGDAPLASFADSKFEVIKPGSSVTLFDPNWINATSIGGQETEENKVLGPFPVCRAGLMASKIEIDLSAPGGLYRFRDNNYEGFYESAHADFKIDVREIDDDAAPLGSWMTLASTVRMYGQDASPTAVKRSFKFQLPKLARFEVQLTRTNGVIKSNGYSVTYWSGCKALVDASLIFPNMTLLAVRLKATNQIANQNENRVSCKVKRKIPVWDGLNWTMKHSKSAVWSIVDMLRNKHYGAGMDESSFVLEELLALDKKLAKRGDFFNGVIDRQLSISQAVSQAARVGRCFAFIQAGRLRLIRDEKTTAPVQVFNTDNIVKDSFAFSFVFWGKTRAKAIAMEFFDSKLRAINHVEEKVTNALAGVVSQVQFFGVDNADHAKREARFEHAQQLYRRRRVQFECEMEALLLSPGDLIRIETPFEGIGTINAKVMAIRPGRNLRSTIEAIIDDPRVYVN
ncbi:MAG: host specificity factor TipJ family phage tail protein [Pseudomonadota bacterium]